MCHYWHGPGRPAAQGSLSADDFRRLLDAYGFRIVMPGAWIRFNEHSPGHAAVAITFDDGLREALDVALPVLEERGLTAFWNVYTGPLVGVPNNLERYRWIRNFAFGSVEAFYVEWEKLLGGPVWCPPDYLSDRTYLSDMDRAFRWWRNERVTDAEYELAMDDLAGNAPPMRADHWLSAGDLRALRASGHVVGFHTHSHYTTMAHLSKEQQALEYATSKWILETILNEPVTTCSHPCGSVTEYGKQWMREHGVTLAWGATMAGTLPYEAPRWSTGLWRKT